MSRPPKSHDNQRVRAHVAGFVSVAELTDHIPQADDIFSGALHLKTGGSTSTRLLSRKVLFRVLQRCPFITVTAAQAAIGRSYAPRTVEMYAAVARVVSKAIEGVLPTVDKQPRRVTIRQAQESIDAPYSHELLALGYIWPFHGSEFPQPKGKDQLRVSREVPQLKGRGDFGRNRLWEFNLSEHGHSEPLY